MGSFNVICNLSGQIIKKNDDVVIIPLVKRNSKSTLSTNSWDLYSPIPMMLEGHYTSYGTIEGTSIFDSLEHIGKDEKQLSEKILLKYLKENFVNENNDIESLDDFIHSSFIKKDINVSIIKSVLQNLEILSIDSKTDDEDKKNLIDGFNNVLKNIGYNSIDEAKEYVIKNEEKKVEVKLSFIMYKKEVLKDFLNTFGNNFENDEDENYTVLLQKQRKKEEDSKETVDFITGEVNYAGGNNPLFTWKKIFKESNVKGKYQSALNQLNTEHSIDTSIINNYYALIGKLWSPSLTISENVPNEEQIQAIEMQNYLSKSQIVKNKKNKI